ncbi:hypothetical protein DAI22_08g221200 [Oryza sativa Japonica Group]|nr:hypothetical protein DAI22_08g221200 [Oryza sativa Japonica Group]
MARRRSHSNAACRGTIDSDTNGRLPSTPNAIGIIVPPTISLLLTLVDRPPPPLLNTDTSITASPYHHSQDTPGSLCGSYTRAHASI